MIPSTDEAVFDAFRRWGYLAADLDPVGYMQPLAPPELALEGEAAARARRCYCGSIGAEFMHIPDAERRQWVAERMEADPPPVDSPRVLDRLIRAGLFEQVLQSRYPGTKRFSLEGIVTLIPVMDEVLDARGGVGRRADGAGHEPSRPAERDGPHRGQDGGGCLRALRGR